MYTFDELVWLDWLRWLAAMIKVAGSIPSHDFQGIFGKMILKLFAKRP